MTVIGVQNKLGLIHEIKKYSLDKKITKLTAQTENLRASITLRKEEYATRIADNKKSIPFLQNSLKKLDAITANEENSLRSLELQLENLKRKRDSL